MGDGKWATMVQKIVTVQGGQIMGRRWCGVLGVVMTWGQKGCRKAKTRMWEESGGHMCGETMIWDGDGGSRRML